VVNLPQGNIQGGFESSLGADYYYFKGIPYAEPPIGKLRFQPPVPIETFPQTPLDCTEHRGISIQKDLFSPNIIGSEDCLYLNIYTPSLQGKFPVMFWIHGGSFKVGSGNCDTYSPEYLIKHQVVIVTINYRLGPLGFLCNPNLGIYGNMGLKDQQLALKFINENIDKFGGDANNITIFGESAGGVAVQFHLLNRISSKFFHKAISQSGSCLMYWVHQLEPVEKSHKLATLLGAKNLSETLQYLLTSDPKLLTKFENKTLSESERREAMMLPFKPVIEILNPTAFITENPLKLLQENNLFQGKPLIMGVNDMEGIVMMREKARELENYLKDDCKFVPRTVNVTFGSQICKKVGEQIKNFYFGNAKIDLEKLIQMAKYQTDRYFNVAHHETVELIAKFQPSSQVFLYQFCFDGKLNYYKKTHRKEVPGACHADDYFYLFRVRALERKLPENSPENEMRRLMCELWTNFAKTGNPSTNLLKWEPMKSLNVMQLNRTSQMVANPDKDRINFWREIYQTWNKGFLKPKL